MRKISVFITLLLLISGFTSCRKGPEDPLLSFKTRKNRISKNWLAYEYKIDGINIIEENKQGSKNIPNCGVQTLDTLIERSIKMVFSKNGNYTSEFTTNNQISAATSKGDEECADYNFKKSSQTVETKTGNWSFTGGSGGTSKREQVLIYQEETREGVIWDIVRLANNELKLKRKYIIPGKSVFTTEEISFYPK